jgi:hypothetical protein
MTHEELQDLIPFYVAGRLETVEASALEQHLRTCTTCTRILEEWREVARIVKAETEVSTRRLPPLPAEIRASRQPAPDTAVRQRTVPTQPAPIVKNPYLRQATERPSRRAYGLAAAFIMVLLGGVVLYIAARGTLQKGENPLTIAEALTPDFTRTPIAIFGASGTDDDLGFLPTSSPAPQAAPPSSTPQPARTAVLPPVVTNTLPVFASLTPLFTPIPNEFGLTMATQCIVTVSPFAEFGVVNMRSGPGEQYDILNAFSINDTVVAVAKSDNGWYRVQFVIAASMWTGWVPESLINLSGSCDELSVFASEGYVPDMMPTLNATPTALFNNSIGMSQYNVITLETVGPIPANTRVRISSAYYTGTEWMYTVVAADEISFADARQSQLQYAPEVTPNLPTPTLQP